MRVALDRELAVQEPAVIDLSYERRTRADGTAYYAITGGRPTWSFKADARSREAAAQAAAQLQGVAKVKVADAAHYASQTAENLTALVIAQAAGYSHILAPATAYGKSVAPRVAALLDKAQISDIIKVVTSRISRAISTTRSPSRQA